MLDLMQVFRSASQAPTTTNASSTANTTPNTDTVTTPRDAAQKQGLDLLRKAVDGFMTQIQTLQDQAQQLAEKVTQTQATLSELIGISTKSGPKNGRLACAWANAMMLRARGFNIPKGSAAESNVTAQANYLKNTFGAENINPLEADVGDVIYIIGKGDNQHIGTVMRNPQTGELGVLTNSSSKGAIQNWYDLSFSSYPGGGKVSALRLPT
jgi:hypothetical protein